MRRTLIGVALETLADGEWHPIGELINAMSPHIRPEVAVRRYKMECSQGCPLDEAIARGRRRIVQNLLADRVRGSERRGVPKLLDGRGKGVLREFRLTKDRARYGRP